MAGCSGQSVGHRSESTRAYGLRRQGVQPGYRPWASVARRPIDGTLCERNRAALSAGLMVSGHDGTSVPEKICHARADLATRLKTM